MDRTTIQTSRAIGRPASGVAGRHKGASAVRCHASCGAETAGMRTTIRPRSQRVDAQGEDHRRHPAETPRRCRSTIPTARPHAGAPPGSPSRLPRVRTRPPWSTSSQPAARVQGTERSMWPSRMTSIIPAAIDGLKMPRLAVAAGDRLGLRKARLPSGGQGVARAQHQDHHAAEQAVATDGSMRRMIGGPRSPEGIGSRRHQLNTSRRLLIRRKTRTGAQGDRRPAGQGPQEQRLQHMADRHRRCEQLNVDGADHQGTHQIEPNAPPLPPPNSDTSRRSPRPRSSSACRSTRLRARRHCR